MKSFFKWVAAYPLTFLMILCCLVGTPFFGGKKVYEKIVAYQSQVLATDALPVWTQEAFSFPQIYQIDRRSTEEEKLAAEAEAEAAAKAAAEAAEAERLANLYAGGDQSYLDDAVFIGDSRTETLALYADWDNATYYTKTGTNIWSIMSDDAAYDPDTGEMISVESALAKRKFGKVYIMLGINELGTGSAESFYQQFKSVVGQLKDLQPDAVIYVESIIHVSESRDAEGDYINNRSIDERNKLLSKLADDKRVYYLDANEVLDDENGYLKEESTFDGVHLQAGYLDDWKAFILDHAVTPPVKTPPAKKHKK